VINICVLDYDFITVSIHLKERYIFKYSVHAYHLRQVHGGCEMKKILNDIKNKVKNWGFSDENSDEFEEEYLELDTSAKRPGSARFVVRPFMLEDFADIKLILDTIREGNTVALVNIKPLKDKDLVELKRAINKLKKTTDAMNGDIAGFSDDYIVVTPSFAEIYRQKDLSEPSGELKE
jgi:SepF-like predicted cell division protein (DUF552 family)